MLIAPTPKNEYARLQALWRYQVLDTLPEANFDELTSLLAEQLNTPIVLISLVDKDRQWFKSKIGLDACETHRDLAFCSHAILHPDQLFIVEDALKDPRFFDNPLVAQDPKIRFYAGAPLVTPEGFAIGTLCVIDRKPRTLSVLEQRSLTVWAHQVVHQLELRQKLAALQNSSQQLQKMNALRYRFFALIAHELKPPFQQLLDCSNQMYLDLNHLDKNELHHMMGKLAQSARQTFRLTDNLLQWSMIETQTIQCHPILFNLAEVVDQICSIYSGVAHQKSVRIKQHIPQHLQIYADLDMSYLMLQHVLANAIQYNQIGGLVQITAHQHTPTSVTIDIQDNGQGMSEEMLQHLFDIEYWVEHPPSAHHAHKIGLGLILCERYAQMNHGSVQVSSQKQQGTTVSLQLPISANHHYSP